METSYLCPRCLSTTLWWKQFFHETYRKNKTKTARTAKQTNNKQKKKQENILYHLPQLVSAELLKDDGDSVFNTRKPTHSLSINTKLTFDALKTELPAPQLQIKAMPNFPHQASSILTTSLIFSVYLCSPQSDGSGTTWSTVNFCLFLIPHFSTPVLC